MTDLFRTRALLVQWTVRSLDDLAALLTSGAKPGTAWHDGDTFNALMERGEGDYLLTHVRTAGDNAPELKGITLTAAKASADYARSLVDSGGIVTLDSSNFAASHEEDDFGRVLAKVTLPDGSDLAQLMIQSNHAVADPA